MEAYEKPVPEPDHVTRPFWEATKQNRLLVQRCPDCGVLQFFPQAHCRGCLCDQLEWVESKGKGTVYSFTVIHRPPAAAFEKDAPYTVGLIDLDEGCRLISNVVEVDPEDVRVGMPVEVVFEEITPEISLPRFRPWRQS
jgi:uncharacterized OB-fold protein